MAQTFDDLVFREPDLRTIRRARARRLLLAVAAICGVTAVVWAILFAAQGSWASVAYEVFILAFSLWVAGLAVRGDISRGAHVLFWAAVAIIAGLVVLFDGPLHAGPRAVHFFFLVLAVGIHFLLIERRQALARDCYSALAFAAFVVVETDLMPIPVVLPLDPGIRQIAAVVTVVVCMCFLLLLTRVFVADIAEAEARLNRLTSRLEDLLENMLPHSVIERLRKEGKTFAEGFASCSILFADIVGFTQLANRAPPEHLVLELNRIFSRFDTLVDRYGLEKIKTIGDAYMVASGIPAARGDHAEALADFALDMQKAIAEFPGLSIRIGINSGAVVAGVIGKKRFIYDLWGDAVNVASRMESQGVPGRIHVTEETKALLEAKFVLEPRGEIAIKGKGTMTTYLLVGRRTAGPSGNSR